MFAFLRWMVSIALFQSSLAYAAFMTLSLALNSSRYASSSKSPISNNGTTSPLEQRGRTGGKNGVTEENRLSDTSSSLSSSSSSSQPLTEDEAQLYALKLWLMLTTLASLSHVGADSLPFFLEFRTLACWMIVFMEPRAHGLMYDRTFHPMLRRIGGWLSALQSKQVMSRVVLLILRGLTTVAVAITNAADKRGFLEEEAVHDLMGGLAFTLRALDDARVFSPVSAPTNREAYMVSNGKVAPPVVSSAERNVEVEWIMKDDDDDDDRDGEYVGGEYEEAVSEERQDSGARRKHRHRHRREVSRSPSQDSYLQNGQPTLGDGGALMYSGNSNTNNINNNTVSDGLRFRRSATEGHPSMRSSDNYGNVKHSDYMSAEEVVQYKGSGWEEKPVENRKRTKKSNKTPSLQSTLSDWMGSH